MKLFDELLRKLSLSGEQFSFMTLLGLTAVVAVVYVMFLAEKLVTFSDVVAVLATNAVLVLLITITADTFKSLVKENEQAEKERAEKEKRSYRAAPKPPFNAVDHEIWVRPPDDTVNGDLYFGPYGRRYGNTSPNDGRRYGNTNPNDDSRCGNVAPSYGRRYGNTSPNDDSRCRRK